MRGGPIAGPDVGALTVRLGLATASVSRLHLSDDYNRGSVLPFELFRRLGTLEMALFAYSRPLDCLSVDSRRSLVLFGFAASVLAGWVLGC